MVPAALDLGLERFLTNSASGAGLPLAVRRFTHQFGSPQPEEAMHSAATRVLASYATRPYPTDRFIPTGCQSDRSGNIAIPVSGERLRSVIGVELAGRTKKGQGPANLADHDFAAY